MKLWLDDIREPPDDSWTWVQTVGETIKLLANLQIEEISLDHDLGPEQTTQDLNGYTVAAWLEERAYNGFPIPPLTACHSQNNVGAHNINIALQRAKEFANRNRLLKPPFLEGGEEEEP